MHRTGTDLDNECMEHRPLIHNNGYCHLPVKRKDVHIFHNVIIFKHFTPNYTSLELKLLGEIAQTFQLKVCLIYYISEDKCHSLLGKY